MNRAALAGEIEQVVQTHLPQVGAELIGMYVYGSHARGTASATSNVDVGLVINKMYCPEQLVQVRHGARDFKFDVFPRSKFASDPVSRVNVEFEQFAGTVIESHVLRDDAGALEAFKTAVGQRSSQIFSAIGLIRFARACKARRVYLKAAARGDAATAATWLYTAFENLCHVILANANVFSNKEWLVQAARLEYWVPELAKSYFAVASDSLHATSQGAQMLEAVASQLDDAMWISGKDHIATIRQNVLTRDVFVFADAIHRFGFVPKYELEQLFLYLYEKQTLELHGANIVATEEI